jgi:glutamate dehydrogenase (NAD(P)+)
MAWIIDTYMNTAGYDDKNSQARVVTGKPVACGGTPGRSKATGQGVVHCITEWARDNAFELEGKTALIQGYGNVCSIATHRSPKRPRNGLPPTTSSGTCRRAKR